MMGHVLPPAPTRTGLLAQLLSLTEDTQQRRLENGKFYDWSRHARPSQQMPPGDWKVWLILAGRGFGKTRTGAETLRHWAETGYAKRMCLLGHTINDVRSIMIEGASGLLGVHPPKSGVRYHASKRQLLWPNGAIATAYSASSYHQLRGPQFDGAWIDELAKFPHPQEVWDQLMLGLRLGDFPRVIITTTPRPTPLIKALMKRDDVVVTTGSTFDNAHNLSQSYLENIHRNYGKTRLGLQEVEGHILEENQGSLWTIDMLERARCIPPIPPLTRIVVAIDPAVTSKETSDETGIIVAGIDDSGQGYVLEDLSGKFTPTQWARIAVEAYKRHQADRIVAEVNNGGDLVEKLVRTVDATVSYTAVRATRGKLTRAEPVAALYEQGKVHHAQTFPKLTHQLLNYNAKGSDTSPDRLDALVWALTFLMLDQPSLIKRKTGQKIWTV